MRKIKSLVLILSTLFFTFGNPMIRVLGIDQKGSVEFSHLKKPNTNAIKKPLLVCGGGLSIVVVAAGVVVYMIKSGAKNGDVEVETDWKEVAKLYKEASESSGSRSPESVEHLADYYRCLMYKDLEICKSDPKKKFSSTNSTEAEKYYKQAADLYDERAKQFSDKNSYGFQINSVKAAELRAKSVECYCEVGSIMREKGINCVSELSRYTFVDAAQAWQKVKGIKASYNEYADAKYSECMAKASGDEFSWVLAAQAWEKVKSDEDLKQSFGGETKYWFAYRAFAAANRLECLLHCADKSTEELRQSWLEASRLDLEASNSPIYAAFAAEAKQRAKCLENE